MEQLEQLSTDDTSLLTDLLKTLKQDYESLKETLAAPREAGRQNLINENVAGSQFLHASQISQVDRDFSKLARKVSETIRASLRFVISGTLCSSCATDAATLQAILSPCVRPPPARIVVRERPLPSQSPFLSPFRPPSLTIPPPEIPSLHPPLLPQGARRFSRSWRAGTGRRSRIPPVPRDGQDDQPRGLVACV